MESTISKRQRIIDYIAPELELFKCEHALLFGSRHAQFPLVRHRKWLFDKGYFEKLMISGGRTTQRRQAGSVRLSEPRPCRPSGRLRQDPPQAGSSALLNSPSKRHETSAKETDKFGQGSAASQDRRTRIQQVFRVNGFRRGEPRVRLSRQSSQGFSIGRQLSKQRPRHLGMGLRRA